MVGVFIVFKLDKNLLKANIGFTLIEVVIVVPLVAIIFLVGFNVFFLINKSYGMVNDSFISSEEIRLFQINIQKEANQARKAELGNNEPEKEDKDKAALVKKSNSELHIYTDIDKDNIPELLIYYLDGRVLKKDVKKASNASNNMKFPYVYKNPPVSSKAVLTNVNNTDIFGDVEDLRAAKSGQEGIDYRKKVKMNIEIKGNDSETIIIQNYLVTKSRAAAE